MGRRNKSGKNEQEDQQKKSSGPSGCGSRAHIASRWGGERGLKNIVISSGFLEAYLTALDADDAGLSGSWAFGKLETQHSVGSRLVKSGTELPAGRRATTAHFRTEEVWEEGPAAWMTRAKEAFVGKAVAGGQCDLIMRVGERYREWAMLPGHDASLPYRRMKMVARKLEELGLGGVSMMEALEADALEGKLPWLFQSMDAADKRQKADAARKQAEVTAKQAAEKAAEARAKAGK